MLAFLFPGQGSQKVGMGQAIVDSYAIARQTFEQADDALGYSISKLCLQGPENELTLTANSQPAILTTSIAVLRAIQQETNLSAQVVAGHSLGEYTALVCAQSLAFEDAVRLVHLRGKFMQQAVAPGIGAMAAVIGLDAEEVTTICKEASDNEVVSCANFNASDQIAIAGHKAAVDRVLALVREKKARAIPLQVSAPFHCALMEPAAFKLAAEIKKVTFADPQIPVVTNVEAKENSDGSRIPKLLVDQVTSPVRWEESVRRLVEIGVTEAIEIGAGRVLCGLVKRISKEIRVNNVENPEQVAALRPGGVSIREATQ